MFKLLVSIAVGVLAILSAWESRAAVILADPFSYSDGTLQVVSLEKWVGHSGPTNQVDVSGSALKLTGSEGQDVNAALAGQPYASTNADGLYSKFRVKFTALPSNTGSYFAHFKDSGAGFRARVWALTNGATSGTFHLGIGSASGSAPSAIHTTALKVDTEYMVVTRLVMSNAVSSLWINPDSETSPSVSTEAGPAISISSYAFRQATGIGTMIIDDLLIGTTFADLFEAPALTNTVDVVPPPRLQVTASLEAPGMIVLRWDTEPGQTYSVLRSSAVTGPFIPMAMDLSFAGARGEYVDKRWATWPRSFYRISSP